MKLEVPPFRVAIYASPEKGTEWWERGSQWLGRCAATGSRLEMPLIGVDPSIQLALTAEPRRYGWHATLKAPMRLSDQANLRQLKEAVSAVCRRHSPIEFKEMQVSRLGNFLALQPGSPPTAVNALADDCVKSLQPLAALATEQELTRRRRAQLSSEEDALMLAWGYPWVLHKFRFHFSLTGSLKGVSDDVMEKVEAAAQAHFAGLPPLRLSQVAIFVEPTAGADFVLLDQVAFGT